MIQNREKLTNQLQKMDCTGYIWMVEEDYPLVFTGGPIDLKYLNRTGNVFNKIQEAYIKATDKKKEVVFHVKCIDGEEHIHEFRKEDFKDGNTYRMSLVSYPSHIQKIRELKFITVSTLQLGTSGAEFKTWQPILQLFDGLE